MKSIKNNHTDNHIPHQGQTNMLTDINELEQLKQNTQEILLINELTSMLRVSNNTHIDNSQQIKKPQLRIKLGCDPTAPDLHLGHTVVLNKLRQFQLLGHKVLFIVGDFTARIGDPTGKNITRPPLTKEQVMNNAQTYKTQVFKILDQSQTEILFNSSWLENLTIQQIIDLSSKYTIARMLERDDFSNRYKKGNPIAIHEFLYPLLQGYDSVFTKADVEIGGTDQKFNLLVARELQKCYGQKPQVVITLPLLEGLDGIQKMSKSLNNYIGINEPPQSMFGKIMSISDELMWRYFELLSFKKNMEISQLKKEASEGKNPKDIKILLAKEIVARFHGIKASNVAHEEFEAQFKQNQVPKNIPEIIIKPTTGVDSIPLANLLKNSGLVSSTSEAMRILKQRGLKINNQVVEENLEILADDSFNIYQIGKRKFAKIKVTKN
jgi:tyrosyl-tRNA synthetase